MYTYIHTHTHTPLTQTTHTHMHTHHSYKPHTHTHTHTPSYVAHTTVHDAKGNGTSHQNSRHRWAFVSDPIVSLLTIFTFVAGAAGQVIHV